MKNIAFVTHENIERTPVCKAMFIDVARGLKDEGYNVSVLSATDRNVDLQRGDESGINYLLFDRRSYGRFSISAIVSLLRAYKMFLSLIRSHDIFFFRSYPTILVFGFIAKTFGKKIIFDTRGLFFEELIDSGKLRSRLIIRPLRFIEKLLIGISDIVICVTDSQKNYYLKNVSNVGGKMAVVPNCAPKASIIEDRSNSGRLELAYVGSLVKWHSPEIVKEICKQFELNDIPYHLTVMTKDLVQAKEIFGDLSESVTLKTHNYRHLPVRFDYGFCLISGGLSKKVCFPVKFLEYIQSGTKVINSSNVDVTREIIEITGAGINVNLNESPYYIAKKVVEAHVHKRNVIPVIDDQYTFKSQIFEIKRLVKKLA